MKRLLLFTVLAAALFGCSKKEDAKPKETRQGVELSFVADKKLTSGEVVEEQFEANVVLIWKAEGKDFKYNGFNDGVYAYDKLSSTSFKADYDFVRIRSEIINLPAGKYFIMFGTNGDVYPKLAYSYTTFTVEAGKFFKLKKNVSSMKQLTYTPW